MNEEHRRILREALVGASMERPSCKDYLLALPNVAVDRDFERGSQIDCPVEL